MNFLLLCLIAAEIPNLGTITHRTGVAFDSDTTRNDQCSVVVEFLPVGAPTNLITITLTNGWLSFGDMAPVPSGPGILGVHFRYTNGDASEVAKYRYDLRRAAPPAPSARLVQVLGAPEGETGLTNEIRKIRQRRVIPSPPAPEYTSGIDAPSKQIVYSPKPLPNGTNLSWGQFQDRLADSVGWGRRRSQ